MSEIEELKKEVAELKAEVNYWKSKANNNTQPRTVYDPNGAGGGGASGQFTPSKPWFAACSNNGRKVIEKDWRNPYGIMKLTTTGKVNHD